MKSLHARRRVIGAMFMAGVFSIGLPFDMAPLPGNCAVAAAASEVSGDTIAIRKNGNDLEFTKKLPRKAVRPKAVKEKVNA